MRVVKVSVTDEQGVVLDYAVVSLEVGQVQLAIVPLRFQDTEPSGAAISLDLVGSYEELAGEIHARPKT